MIDNDKKDHNKKSCTFTIKSLATFFFKTVAAFSFFGGLLLLYYTFMVSNTTTGIPSIKSIRSKNITNDTGGKIFNISASTSDAKHDVFVSPNNKGAGATNRNSRISDLKAKLSLTSDNDYQQNYTSKVAAAFDRKRVAEWLNIPAVIDEAQIPPPHSPWHVLPTEWRTTTNSSSVSDLRRSMQHDIRRYIEEDGLSTKSRTVINQRLYLIRNGTLWKLSNQALDNNRRWPEIEEMMQSALDIGSYILESKRSLLSEHYYKLLQWLLGIDESDNSTLSNTTTKISIPLFVNKGDYKGCAETQRIPQFTFAMESSFLVQAKRKSFGSCIPFALPMYDMWTYLQHHSKFAPKDWYLNQGITYSSKSPWDSKVSKVLWRGSTTGGVSHKVESFRDVPRFQLVLLGLNFSNITDFGFVKLNQGWEEEPFKSEIHSQFGPLKPRMKFMDFMNYKAVLDINGNSWSSRFGHLLCLNSVILKVETNDFVNYFEYPGGTDGSPELLPWHHYVPVMRNLSNLVELSSYVLDPNNEKEMLEIVKHANQWCQHKMTVTQFAIDVLWMILNYVDLLYFHNPTQQAQQKHGHQGFATTKNHQNDHKNPLNFDWMDQYVYQSHEWERAIGNNKTLFEAKA